MLTKKQELAIQLHLNGASKTDAVFRAYDCKKYHTAGAIATKIFKKQEVKDRLNEKQALIDNVSVERIDDFKEQLVNTIPPSRIISSIKAHIECGDKRTEAQARQDYLKILGLYDDRDINVKGIFGLIDKVSSNTDIEIT